MPARPWVKPPTKLGKCLLLGVLFTSLWLLGPIGTSPLSVSAAHAQGRGEDGVEKVIKLRILESNAERSASKTGQSAEAERFEAEKAAELTQLTARSVRKRLKAAGIKDFSVTTPKAHEILVRVRGNASRAVLAGIVVPSGRLELRSVEEAGARWVRAAAHLPDGVELRQKEGSLDAAQAYLWSADAELLRAALASLEANPLHKSVLIDGARKIELYPAHGGWRTLVLSAPIATQQDVASAAIHQGKTGEPYVQLLFQKDLSDALESDRTLSMNANSWAVLLDGEVVSVLSSRAHNLGASLNIKPPEPLRTRQARQGWAQQVAGRLAAYIPVRLVEDRMIAPKK